MPIRSLRWYTANKKNDLQNRCRSFFYNSISPNHSGQWKSGFGSPIGDQLKKCGWSHLSPHLYRLARRLSGFSRYPNASYGITSIAHHDCPSARESIGSWGREVMRRIGANCSLLNFTGSWRDVLRAASIVPAQFISKLV